MAANKLAIVTGAGSGLGRELCIKLSNDGFNVIGIGRNIESLKQTATFITHGTYDYFDIDVGNYILLKQAFIEIINQYGRIDIIFNNAAIYPKVNFLEETNDAWEYTINTNINGVANCCKAVLPFLIKQKRGIIFNVGSWADQSPIKNSAAYSTSKGAIHALTKAISKDIEHLELDIEVHEWIPGHLKTQMSNYTGIEPEIAAQWAIEILHSKTRKSKNCIYTNNIEWTPPKSIKQRIIEYIPFWKNQS